jgi:hypothetical protein
MSLMRKSLGPISEARAERQIDAVATRRASVPAHESEPHLKDAKRDGPDDGFMTELHDSLP